MSQINLGELQPFIPLKMDVRISQTYLLMVEIPETFFCIMLSGKAVQRR